MPEHPDDFDEETLETWESFAARFERVADIFLTKYIRAYILLQDPGFNGTLRDVVNLAEKLDLVDDAQHWMNIRELRNISANEYTEKRFSCVFQTFKIGSSYIAINHR